jgi:hypothetical protein
MTSGHEFEIRIRLMLKACISACLAPVEHPPMGWSLQCPSSAGVAQWQSPSLPSWLCGFDPRHPLQNLEPRTTPARGQRRVRSWSVTSPDQITIESEATGTLWRSPIGLYYWSKLVWGTAVEYHAIAPQRELMSHCHRAFHWAARCTRFQPFGRNQSRGMG